MSLIARYQAFFPAVPDPAGSFGQEGDQCQVNLDIYVRDVDRSEVAWYANKTTTYLTLNGDRYPNCADSGPDAEIITGSFKQSNEFETWYNQYSDCAPELTPVGSEAGRGVGCYNPVWQS